MENDFVVRAIYAEVEKAKPIDESKVIQVWNECCENVAERFEKEGLVASARAARERKVIV